MIGLDFPEIVRFFTDKAVTIAFFGYVAVEAMIEIIENRQTHKEKKAKLKNIRGIMHDVVAAIVFCILTAAVFQIHWALGILYAGVAIYILLRRSEFNEETFKKTVTKMIRGFNLVSAMIVIIYVVGHKLTWF